MGSPIGSATSDSYTGGDFEDFEDSGADEPSALDGVGASISNFFTEDLPAGLAALNPFGSDDSDKIPLAAEQPPDLAANPPWGKNYRGAMTLYMDSSSTVFYKDKEFNDRNIPLKAFLDVDGKLQDGVPATFTLPIKVTADNGGKPYSMGGVEYDNGLVKKFFESRVEDSLAEAWSNKFQFDICVPDTNQCIHVPIVRKAKFVSDDSLAAAQIVVLPEQDLFNVKDGDNLGTVNHKRVMEIPINAGFGTLDHEMHHLDTGATDQYYRSDRGDFYLQFRSPNNGKWTPVYEISEKQGLPGVMGQSPSNEPAGHGPIWDRDFWPLVEGYKQIIRKAAGGELDVKVSKIPGATSKTHEILEVDPKVLTHESEISEFGFRKDFQRK